MYGAGQWVVFDRDRATERGYQAANTHRPAAGRRIRPL